jgi:hypothetical protein
MTLRRFYPRRYAVNAKQNPANWLFSLRKFSRMSRLAADMRSLPNRLTAAPCREDECNDC